MKNISKGTIIRTTLLVLALINQVLTASGINPIPYDSQEVELFMSTLLTGVTAVMAWWKNNSFTQKAIEADEKLHS